MTVPERPQTVPAKAEFDARRKLWELAETDDEGARHGLYRSFRCDGSLYQERHFEHGKPHGPERIYHPSGQLAREGRNVQGEPEGEFVSFASAEPAAIPLRECCVPQGAQIMRSRFENGRLRGELFFDRDERRLLSDGSLFPERPLHVPESARFEEGAAQWVVGAFDEKARPHGVFTRWSRSGTLVLEAQFERGQRHGYYRSYEPDGTPVEECRYRGGVLDGLYRGAVTPGLYASLDVALRVGQFTLGMPTGIFRYLDSAGAEVARTDFGAPLPSSDLIASRVFESKPANTEHWITLAHELTQKARITEAFFAFARSAAAAGSRVPLEEYLSRHHRPMAAGPSRSRVAELTRDRRNPPTLDDWIRALHEGIDASEVLRRVARLLPASRAAHDLISASILLDPERLELRWSRASIALEIGDPQASRREATEIREREAGRDGASSQAPDPLEIHLNAYYPCFEFWPAHADLPDRPYEELPREVLQPLSQVQTAIIKAALRLAQVRRATLAKLAAIEGGSRSLPPPWLVPEVPLPPETTPPPLGSWQFELEEDEEKVIVRVEEHLELSEHSLVGLLRAARREWAGLCWLCWGGGLDRIAVPDRIEPPASFAQALGSSMERLWRASDRLTTQGLKARLNQVPGFTWHGHQIDRIPIDLVPLVIDELKEQRAMLFWLADPDCQSPWQDDLRPN